MTFDDPKLSILRCSINSMNANAYPHRLEDEYKAKIGQPCTDFGEECLRKLQGYSGDYTEEELANEYCIDLIRRFLSEYFAQVSRESAVTICNILMIADPLNGGRIELLRNVPELAFSAFGFADGWNKRHPEEKPIRKNPGDYIV